MAAKNYKELYEQAKDQQIADGFKDLKGDIKEIKDEVRTTNKHLEKVNGRLGKVEGKVFPDQPQTISQLPPPWKNPELLKLATYFFGFLFVCAAIYAALKGVKLPL